MLTIYAQPAETTPELKHLRVGHSKSTFFGVDVNDAQVATFPTFFENFKAHTGGEFDKKTRTVKPVYKGLAVHTTSGLVSWQLGE